MSSTPVPLAEISWTKTDGGKRVIVEDPSVMLQRVFDAELYLTTRLRRKINSAPSRFTWFVVGYWVAMVFAGVLA